MAKRKQLTNAQFVKQLMEYSENGALAQIGTVTMTEITAAPADHKASYRVMLRHAPAEPRA
jgi:hypothetical protein